MLTLYFSGTGNTKYIAEKFSVIMKSDCCSIENDADFVNLIKKHKQICICYPIYGSRVPRIFKEFIRKHQLLFQGKDIIILITQLMFSGDGARAFTDLFPENFINVIYAEHINMPNNICNFALFPVKNGGQNRRMLKTADAKLIKICENIKQGKIVRRGFNPVSRLLGSCQGVFEETMNESGKKSVLVYDSCIACGACIKTCPMENLKLVSGKIEHNGNCTLCYRCVNLCPEKAITVFIHKKPNKQYHGI